MKRKTIWEQFVDQKKEWIGGLLQDNDRDFFIKESQYDPTTKITDITFEPNGEGYFFSVMGEGFSCGFSDEVGGITGGNNGWTVFRGYAGHEWRIKKPLTNKPK